MRKKAEFKIGDKVKVIAEYMECPKGMEGVVCSYHSAEEVGVYMPDFKFGHNCRGTCKAPHGYYFHSETLELISDTTPMKLLDFKPGMKITDYVKSLLTTEKNQQRLKWLRTFDNCILPEEVRDTVDEALTIVLRRDKFEEWGISDHFEKGLTNSILIYGPPGTGKTMLCESIASVLGKNLMKITPAEIQSSIPGQTEQNISKSFEVAKKKNAVVMFDECDSLLYNRNAVGMILAAEINHLLMEIENFDGVVLFTTNRLHKLDEALQRRIIAKIELGLPDYEARKQIWHKLVPPKMPLTKDVDLDKLAIAELAGGDIKNAIILAARKAVAKNKNKIEMVDFVSAVDGVVKAKEAFRKSQPQSYDQFMEEQISEMNREKVMRT